jgi:hypothetical protein
LPTPETVEKRENVFHVPELHVAKSKGDEKSIFMSGERLRQKLSG